MIVYQCDKCGKIQIHAHMVDLVLSVTDWGDENLHYALCDICSIEFKDYFFGKQEVRVWGAPRSFER